MDLWADLMDVWAAKWAFFARWWWLELIVVAAAGGLMAWARAKSGRA